ncbi:response regulator transcription factor [Micromonospora sp. NPDC048935]|uniref:response regulator transcription factor n=1 Tax=Micromonospora sp. NPDC048935 TaxID=3364262 RepID=UPI003720962F
MYHRAQVVRRGPADLLHAAGDIEVVGESGSVREATARIPALRPDVAVLDVFLAEKTVKNYVSSLLAKLGLERRTQAAVLATRLLGQCS